MEADSSAGWYLDPTNIEYSRLWDGKKWTHFVRTVEGEICIAFQGLLEISLELLESNGQRPELVEIVIDPEAITSLTTSMVSPGWHIDPTGEYKYRYWTGAAWTREVQTEGGRELTCTKYLPADGWEDDRDIPGQQRFRKHGALTRSVKTAEYKINSDQPFSDPAQERLSKPVVRTGTNRILIFSERTELDGSSHDLQVDTGFYLPDEFSYVGSSSLFQRALLGPKATTSSKANFGKTVSSAGSYGNEPANPLAGIQPMTIAVIVSSLLVVILLLGILFRGSSTPTPPTVTQPSSGGNSYRCRNVQTTKYWDPYMFNGQGGYKTEYTCGD